MATDKLALQRELTLDDIGAIVALTARGVDRMKIYKMVEAIARETVGWRLLTTLAYDEEAQVVRRLHSSDVAVYPIGGTKPLSKITASHQAMEEGEVFLAASRDDVRKAFFDHELIFSLGITAILNAPIRHGGRRLGTLNFCGEEGTYGEKQVERAQILAGLLVPTLLAELV